MTNETIRHRTVADFFAGIGLVTLGLQSAGWRTIYALDYDELKELQYTTNFGRDHFHMKDISKEHGAAVPQVTLAHASFPCTDLSLAGRRGGIRHGESSAFWEFARIVEEMQDHHGDANPPMILLENVEGLLTSNAGEDLNLVLQELNKLGYKVDLLRINAAHFVPQSRVRIFIIGIHKSLIKDLSSIDITQEFSRYSSNARPQKIQNYISSHGDIDWYFHRLPNLPERTINLESVIDPSAEWWPAEKRDFLYNQLHERQKYILEAARNSPKFEYFSGFRRMRKRDGISQSTVELRNDGIAGCLRTPKGGSAKQIIVRAGQGRIDARLYNAKEAGKLMGAFEFHIPESITDTQSLFGFGDAVCVQALEWIGNEYLNDFLMPENSRQGLSPRNHFAISGAHDQIAMS
jgi:DNA (cytosine-5)-methyltransferase 1